MRAAALPWPIAAFAPRGTGLVLYFNPEFLAHHPLLAGLGPHRLSKGCLYIKRLADVNLPALRSLVVSSLRRVRAKA